MPGKKAGFGIDIQTVLTVQGFDIGVAKRLRGVLQYVLQNGGSGYFPIRMVEPLIDEGKLHLVKGAPTARRPAYMVYSAQPKDDEALNHALDGLREIAGDTGD